MTDLPTTGYPHKLRVAGHADGPLTLTSPHHGRFEFEVTDGVVIASTPERAERIMRDLGAVLVLEGTEPDAVEAEQDTDTPPAGSGDQPPAGGAKSRGRNSAAATTRKD